MKLLHHCEKGDEKESEKFRSKGWVGIFMDMKWGFCFEQILLLVSEKTITLNLRYSEKP